MIRILSQIINLIIFRIIFLEINHLFQCGAFVPVTKLLFSSTFLITIHLIYTKMSDIINYDYLIIIIRF